jgi:protein arginine kinase activator
MKCDICSKKASVHLTEIVDGKVMEMHLCQDCAQQKSAQMQKEFGLADLLAGLTDFQNNVQVEAEKKIAACPHCGITFEEFKEVGRLGCSGCYEAFAVHLDPLLRRIHGANRHYGKKPTGQTSVVSAVQQTRLLESLKVQLHEAVQAENFEQAATLRDKIREIEESV